MSKEIERPTQIEGALPQNDAVTGSSYIAASYVKLAESAGTRVIPLIYNDVLFQHGLSERSAHMEKPMHGSLSVPYLPLDVLAKILAELPIKSLLRVRVVCKSWCSLVSSQQFVKKYSSKVTTSPSRLIMNSFGLVNDLTFCHLHDSIVVRERSIDFGIEKSNYCVMGSCDGLVCVKECSHGMIILWNPSTRGSKILPCISEVEEGKVWRWKYGFGYDCNSDDYKVVTLSLEEKPLDMKGYRWCSYKTMMYSLRTDSWRRIGDSPIGYVFIDECAAFVSGALHWVADRKPSDTRVIISLDLTTETYIEFPQPDYDSILVEVGASRGCLCLLACDNDEYFDIWVMNEYGVRESWTKSIKLPFLWGDKNCLGCLKPLTWFTDEKGEIILSIAGNVASYNANRNSVRYLSTQNDDYICLPPGYVFYVESLFSPNAYSRNNKIRRHLSINIVQEKIAVKDTFGTTETCFPLQIQNTDDSFSSIAKIRTVALPGWMWE